MSAQLGQWKMNFPQEPLMEKKERQKDSLRDPIRELRLGNQSQREYRPIGQAFRLRNHQLNLKQYI